MSRLSGALRVVQTPVDRSADPAAATFHRLTVADVRHDTDDSAVVTFEVPPGLEPVFEFRPGQHLTLRTVVDGDETRRSYSICSTPDHPELRVAIRRVPGGLFSNWALDSLRPGSAIDVMAPTGNFTLEHAGGHPGSVVAIAGGSGITPVISILAHALHRDPDLTATLVYVNRTVPDIMFLEELQNLKNRYIERFELLHVLTREERASSLLSGRLDGEGLERLIESGAVPAQADAWFLCGPLGLVEAMRDTLSNRGVDGRHIHTELFYAGSQPDTGDTAHDTTGVACEAVLELAGRRTRFEILPGESVLDAAGKVRADLPYSCRGGVCSTCKARVIEGEVVMDRNWALEPDEVEAGYILTCQSHPTTPTLEIDFG